tara:strand:+ start:1651 stop:2106 length:456 start_codon:yes stop_codon:yes gene_type:complete
MNNELFDKEGKIPSAIIMDAINLVSSGIMVTDIDANIVWVNDFLCELTKYSHEELIGKNASIFSNGDNPRKKYDKMWNILLSKTSWMGKLTNKKKDGTIYRELSTISPILSKKNIIIGYIGIQQDITVEDNLRSKLVNKAEEMSKEINGKS